MAFSSAEAHQCNERARLAICKLHANNTKKVLEHAEFDMVFVAKPRRICIHSNHVDI